jgi:hypothetical protein
MTNPITRGAALLLALAAAHPTLSAQTLASRIAAVRDGQVRMSFASPEGVCGDGLHFIGTRRADGRLSMHVRSMDDLESAQQSWASDAAMERACRPGPVRVALTMQGGRPVAVTTQVGGGWTAMRGATDLGTVSPAEAQAYLLDVASTAADPAASAAILPATLAAAPAPWGRLLGIARRGGTPGSRAAFKWLGRAAAEQSGTCAADGTRSAAVYALRRRPRGEAVPALLRIARQTAGPQRCDALLVLGKMEEPGALPLFAQILHAG